MLVIVLVILAVVVLIPVSRRRRSAMNFQDLFVGALTLKTQTFEALRERSDVFNVVYGAVVCGIGRRFFAAIPTAISDITPLMNRGRQVEEQARRQF